MACTVVHPGMPVMLERGMSRKGFGCESNVHKQLLEQSLAHAWKHTSQWGSEFLVRCAQSLGSTTWTM